MHLKCLHRCYSSSIIAPMRSKRPDAHRLIHQNGVKGTSSAAPTLPNNILKQVIISPHLKHKYNIPWRYATEKAISTSTKMHRICAAALTPPWPEIHYTEKKKTKKRRFGMRLELPSLIFGNFRGEKRNLMDCGR